MSELVYFKAYAAGGYHSLFLDCEGSVWSCGNNEMGQLGVGDNINRKQPSKITNLPPIRSIHPGFFSSYFIDESGGAWQMGKGSSSSPELIENIPPIEQIASGQYHTILLDCDGFLWGKGSNRDCELGVPNRCNVEYWRKLDDHIPNVKSVQVGYLRSLFLDHDGMVWGFGNAKPGITKFEVPVIKQISMWQHHALLLDEEGLVWGLGDNKSAQLGERVPEPSSYNYNRFVYHHTAIQIENLPKIKRVCAGEYNSLFLDEDGGVWGRGYNGEGQLGLGDDRDRERTPVRINARIKFQEIHTGAYFTTLVDCDGSFWGCGSLTAGMVGVKHLPTKITSFPCMFPISRTMRTKSARKT